MGDRPAAVSYASQTRVRFRHCDPAGIVFYPRYFEIINDFVEEWFDQALGHSYHKLHVEMHLGTPMASVQCRFTAPSRWNDVLHQRLTVLRVGSTSITMDVRLDGENGEQRLAATLTLVMVDMRTMRPTPVPQAVRQRISAGETPRTTTPDAVR